MAEEKNLLLSEAEKTIGTPSSSVSLEQKKPLEFGGPEGLEPVRYGDWEKKGRCSDF